MYSTSDVVYSLLMFCLEHPFISLMIICGIIMWICCSLQSAMDSAVESATKSFNEKHGTNISSAKTKRAVNKAGISLIRHFLK